MNFFKQHLTIAKEILNSSTLSGALSRNALGSLLVRVGALFLAFALNVILARSLGVDEYGSYVYVIGWLNVLLVPATFGFDKLLVRQISIYKSHGEWNRLKGIFHFSMPRALSISVVVALVLTGTVYFTLNDQRLALLFYWIAVLIPLFAVIRVQQATLQGLNSVALGQLPEFVIQPLMLLILVLIIFLTSNSQLVASQMIIFNSVATVVALLSGNLFLRKVFALNVPSNSIPMLESQNWTSSLLPLMLMSGIFILNDQVATILLGFLSTSSQVAVFAAAERWSRFVVFLLLALNPAMAPIFASLYARNDRERLQKVVSLSAQIIALFACIPLIAYIAVPGLFLSVFGSDFAAGKLVLITLGIGQFVNAFTGSVGVLLSMTGYEKVVVIGAGLGILANLFLGFLLIPSLDSTGAAISSSAGLIITNTILSIFVFRKLKLYPTAIGSIFASNKNSLPL